MVEVKSDMAGTIAEIHVSDGATVFAGQELMILESMKMHIPVTSPVTGVVELRVRTGDHVKGSQPLAVVKSPA